MGCNNIGFICPLEKRCPLVFEKTKRYYILRGGIYCTQNHSRKGSLRNLRTTLADNTRSLRSIAGTQHHREGFGRRLNPKEPRASSKSDTLTFQVRPCSGGYDDMLLLDHAVRLYVRALSRQASCTLSRRISHSIQEEFVLMSPLWGAE